MVTGRVMFLIDGFNIYHSLREQPHLWKYKWLNLYRLCQILIPKRCQITKVYYCSAYATWDANKMARHQQYVRLLKTTPVEVVLGRFKEKSVKCRLCHREFKTSIEKETDINIAIKLVQGGILVNGGLDKLLSTLKAEFSSTVENSPLRCMSIMGFLGSFLASTSSISLGRPVGTCSATPA